ncbi:1,4-dihydroxy-2-naphthoate polyprenyltransferase [Siphonobacter sp.]|uniref:1,4-dihydroxy-2-naphthoate polyprenyltransferase n=1 Tax=Siphonobacter sp. TaxID=1869184 RepID=UPI003B3A2A0F
MRSWISAARPRTLPLSLSCILMGSFLAAAQGGFRWSVFGLAVLTTVLLQVLSNFANDYGDSVSGLDNDERKVATRAVQTGAITKEQMRTAILSFSVLTLASGLWLLYVALEGGTGQEFWYFLGLGILCIIAAITYTVGKRPYGYAGLGDLSVLMFFGWVGVLGTYYLHTRSLDWSILLPATSCGVFAVGVLNINNIRDLDNDRRNGKNSIPVRLGAARAKTYHWLLLSTGLVCAAAYVILEHPNWSSYLFLLTLPLFWKIASGVQKGQRPEEIDPYLKRMSLSTLLFVILFGIGQLL